MDYYPGNKAGNYKVQLAHPINLRGRWEVALAEIQYPRTWKNITRDATFICWEQGTGTVYEVIVPEGHYYGVPQLLETITDGLPAEVKKEVKFQFRPQTGKVETVLGDGYNIYWKDDLLKRLLGVHRDEFLGPIMTKTKYPADINLGFYSLFLYTDIIQPVLVGDAAVPLLQIVPIEGQYGDYITKTYTKLHYVPLQAVHFESIEMNISTDTGQDVQFDYGKVVVKLHFRPRRLPFM
jgi:hypothetical protein